MIIFYVTIAVIIVIVLIRFRESALLPSNDNARPHEAWELDISQDEFVEGQLYLFQVHKLPRIVILQEPKDH